MRVDFGWKILTVSEAPLEQFIMFGLFWPTPFKAALTGSLVGDSLTQGAHDQSRGFALAAELQEGIRLSSIY